MQKALSLFEKGPLALVAGDLNPRPLGYEPYDVRLWRLGSSLVTALASAEVRYEVFLGPSASPPSRPVPPRLVHKCVHKSASSTGSCRQA